MRGRLKELSREITTGITAVQQGEKSEQEAGEGREAGAD